MYSYIEPITTTIRKNPLPAAVAALALAWAWLPLAFGVVAAVAVLFLLRPERTLVQRAETAVSNAKREQLSIIMQVSATMADEKQMAQRAEAERKQSEMWRDRAAKAAYLGDDARARDCLERKRVHDANHAELVAELQRQRAAIEELRPHVDAMHVGTPDRSGMFLTARARRAEAKRTVILSAAGLSGDENGMGAVSADVDRAEAEADALADLLRRRRDPVAEEHDREERDDAIEAELEELKRNVRVGVRRALPAKRSA